jgi:hypothetical protein
MLGLTPPATRPPQAQTPPPAGPTYSVGGLMQIKPLSTLQAEERAASLARANEANLTPVVQGLAAQIRRHWMRAKTLKEPFEHEMLSALRAKRGEYDPDKLAKIRAKGGSEIYMMLFATKARQFKALIADVLIGSGQDKPWTVKPSPVPDLPPMIVAELLQGAQEIVAQAEMSGAPMSMEDVRQLLRDAKEAAEASVMTEAKVRCQRAERHIEDLLVEGHWLDGLFEFIDDMAVFKSAFLAGPIVMRVPVLKWEDQADGTQEPTATYENRPQWQRIDPLMVYPSEDNKTLHEGFLIIRHKLSRYALYNMIGVPGYSEDAIRQVLDQHGEGGLHEWLQVDSERAQIETGHNHTYQDELIDALQYWGRASGKMLRDWGMTPEEVPDEAKEYDIEAWQIGDWVIKAAINTDPMAKRPYYKESFESVPGSFWGTSLYDSMRDCESMCQGAARALANNLGIASGPQVWVNIDRLPANEAITELEPWKLWQTTADPMGGTAAPVGFFQPASHAQELMAVYERFSALADEYTGIPKYMAGVSGSEGGAGRTASGMSMMITNAGKTIKKVIGGIDFRVIAPSVQDTAKWIMRYQPHPDINGDLEIQARGALSLIVRDTAQVRRNEFLQATMNPIDMQIVGMEGRAAVLRESVKAMDMNSNVVPPDSIIKARMYQQAVQEQQMALNGPQPGQPGAQESAKPQGTGKTLQDGQGSPATCEFRRSTLTC